MPHRPLSAEQQRALQALTWLHNERARQEGRTYVQALAYLHEALHRPRSEWITVEDHADHRDSDQHLVNLIASIAHEYGARCEVQHRRFRLDLRLDHRSNELGRFLASVLAEGQAPAATPILYGPLCTHSAQSWSINEERGWTFCSDCGTEIRRTPTGNGWLQVRRTPEPPTPQPATTAWERLLKDDQ